MSVISVVDSSHSTLIEPSEIVGRRGLVLVQNHLVISTFDVCQVEVAIDLGRVLCHALAQPVDLFWRCAGEPDGVQVGAIADIAGSQWTRIAHVCATFLKGINVERYDSELAENVVKQNTAQ